ncbi:AmmeMemoRadiSam system radical SAM enzyme [Geoalkalibacter halelectricus]|uniref:AmmeMemoRadiSam system radical SAM enzyme n=1 Tax=Geoalkalibacter halelectricus TaxID=2847045 RepID=A0ABY5ZQC0_9BACT|nr:AmmeMemoRadiSam system radical SAM enzyme [Geoalkalibacter halelectricus]MDO3376720.1 AmmeMemoRadiSam system radical SAM enzyme [Geoalkalibacter halelectricus]UWZ81328.1 AmmeMemoRadiSam system radical SAM enzyme [Geoalkalibacter halelectricus]
MKEAMFWEKAGDHQVRCGLCRFRCLIAEGRRGVCGVRENRAGILYTLVYGRSVAENVDPIEKKPLFHFHPGSLSYSVATVGCNFRCLHCQNHQISQVAHDSGVELTGHPLPPAEIVRRAKQSGCRSIAYTYTEPTIFFEYAYDTAVLARREGIKNVFVTNGYTTAQALAAIAPYLDGANVDLKGFSENFYREVVGATLAGVLDTLKEYRRLGIWIEVTTLLIPGRNDQPGELRKLANFIAKELGVDTPWHVTAFYPTYKLTDAPPTPAQTLRLARKIGLEAGLRYVYTGNIPGEQGESTFCSGCGELLFERRGFRLGRMNLNEGRCRSCATPVAGVGLSSS